MRQHQHLQPISMMIWPSWSLVAVIVKAARRTDADYLTGLGGVLVPTSGGLLAYLTMAGREESKYLFGGKDDRMESAMPWPCIILAAVVSAEGRQFK